MGIREFADLSPEEQAEIRCREIRVRAAWDTMEQEDYLAWVAVYGEPDEENC